MPNDNVADLLKCAIQVLGRIAIPPERVREVVGARGKKQIRAFNLFDGTRTMAEVAKKAKIDQGNLSRTVGRWVANGFAYWIGAGNESRLLHVYPIAETEGSGARRKRGK